MTAPLLAVTFLALFVAGGLLGYVLSRPRATLQQSDPPPDHADPVTPPLRPMPVRQIAARLSERPAYRGLDAEALDAAASHIHRAATRLIARPTARPEPRH